jgi:RHS repeat-associated protein
MKVSNHSLVRSKERCNGCSAWRKPAATGFRKSCRSQCLTYVAHTASLGNNSRTCFEGPFGEVIRATGPMAKVNPFRFSTKYQDDETDLLYYGYRYEKDGRWISRDPIGERGGKNLYGFVQNEAVNYKDFLGLMKVCCSEVRGPWYERMFRHCELANSCKSGEDAYDVWVDTSESRKMDNGKSCKCATKSDIEACLKRHPYSAHPRGDSSLPWPLDEIDNNCQTSVILSLGSCCLKSNWRPDWYAGGTRGKCIRGHQVAVGPPVYSVFVCDEWELPDWTGDSPPSDTPPDSGPSWPGERPPRPGTGPSR